MVNGLPDVTSPLALIPKSPRLKSAPRIFSSRAIKSFEKVTLPSASAMPFTLKARPKAFSSSVRTALLALFSSDERVSAESAPE